MSTAAVDIRPLGIAELVDKESQSSMLVSAMARNRLGGTLLFYGSDGSGKSSLAFWLAASLNCERHGGLGAACGECGSCRKVASLSHPDVFWSFPLPGNHYSSGVPDAGKLEQLYKRKRERPAQAIEFAEKAEHHLAAVGRIKAEAGRSCYEGRRKVFVVTHADRLRLEAANAFLKLLEEPREGVTIILCTSRPSSLLPTILSRCQRMQLTRLTEDTVEGLLAGRYGLQQSAAERAAEVAEGNLSVALGLGQEGALDAQREWVDRTLVAVQEKSGSSMLALLDDRKGPFHNRGDFERYSALLTSVLRDVLLACVTGRRSEKEQIEAIAARVADSRKLIKLVGKTVNLGDSLNRNVNLRLLGYSLLNEMREVLGERAGK
jgi:DNA polymerase III delta' subunit